MTSKSIVEAAVRPPPTHPTVRACVQALFRGEPGVVFPAVADQDLYLGALHKLPPGTILPARVNGFLDLGKLEVLPPDAVLPAYVSGSLWLDYLEALTDGVSLPAYIGGDLCLRHLETPPAVQLPRVVGELYLPLEIQRQLPRFNGEE